MKCPISAEPADWSNVLLRLLFPSRLAGGEGREGRWWGEGGGKREAGMMGVREGELESGRLVNEGKGG